MSLKRKPPLGSVRRLWTRAPAGRAVLLAGAAAFLLPPFLARAAVAGCLAPGIGLLPGARRLSLLAAALTIGVGIAGCGSGHATTARLIAPGPGTPPALIREARPIGRGPRFHPPALGPVTGPCRVALGLRYGVHVELFAADRVVLVARGIGVRPPLRFTGGRISRARCYGDLATLEPTGVVLVRPGPTLRLSRLFAAWAQPLSRRRLASFRAARETEVAVFVNGRRWRGAPGDVPLVAHDEIVLEVGPRVPPHSTYGFPTGS